MTHNYSILKRWQCLFLFMALLTGTLSLYAQDDRKAFDLKGNVRTYAPEVSDNGFILPSRNATFKNEGMLQLFDGIKPTVKRDSQKRIVRIEVQEGEGTRFNDFVYDSNGRIIEVKNSYLNEDTDEETLDKRTIRTFDNNNHVTQETVYNEDGSVRATYTYKYTDIDEQGNWTRRTVTEPSQDITDQPETCTINYSDAGSASGVAQTSAIIPNTIDQAVAQKSAKKKTTTDWTKNIILAIVFILLFVHSIYERYIKKPEFSELPNHWTTEQESEAEAEALNQMATAIETCTLMPGTKDNFVPTTRQQLNNLKEALRNLRSVSPQTKDGVEIYNGMAKEINRFESRKFAGSKMYLIVGGIVVAVIAALRIADGEILQGLCYFLFSVGAYWLGSQKRFYQLLAQDLKGRGGNAGCMAGLLGGLFAFAGSGSTWITTYYDELGRPVASDEDNSEHLVYPALAFIGIVALALFMPFVGLINYIRFYIIHR